MRESARVTGNGNRNCPITLPYVNTGQLSETIDSRTLVRLERMTTSVPRHHIVQGMRLSVRFRRDFTVTDADGLLAAARRTYCELHSGASAAEANDMVACAADALFVILEQAGLFGRTADDRLADHASNGLATGGWRAQVVLDEPHPLAPRQLSDCLRGDDVFVLPPGNDR
jgi:hypothetical protein